MIQDCIFSYSNVCTYRDWGISAMWILLFLAGFIFPKKCRRAASTFLIILGRGFAN